MRRVTTKWSIAETIHVWPGFATRRSSLAALPLIRIENLTPNLIPIQYRVAGVSEPVDSDREVVKVFEIVLNGKTDDIRPAAAELMRDQIQRIDHWIRQSCSHLLGHGRFDSRECSNLQQFTVRRSGDQLPRPSFVLRGKLSFRHCGLSPRPITGHPAFATPAAPVFSVLTVAQYSNLLIR